MNERFDTGRELAMLDVSSRGFFQQRRDERMLLWVSPPMETTVRHCRHSDNLQTTSRLTLNYLPGADPGIQRMGA